MLEKDILLIINPNASKGRGRKSAKLIQSIFKSRGRQCTVAYTKGAGHAATLARKGVQYEYKVIIAAGGDGTVNYVVNLLQKHELHIPIAVLPAGTANDFASMLGVRGADIVKACAQILDGEFRPIDLGKVNGTYFVNVFSCGLFTDVSQKTPTILKNTFGKLAYYVGGVGELQRFRKMHITIHSDGGDYDGNCIIFYSV